MPALTAANSRPTRQRGAATLIVVMVLFFIMSLVAAYANRNLIFEQRTSANQYRSTQALETAQAGLEWAIAQLNNQRIDANCISSAAVGDTSFRDRYIVPDPVTGTLTAKMIVASGEPLTPGCVLNGNQWRCSCPTDSAPSLAAPATTDVAPAFRVRFQRIGPAPPAPPGQAGVIRIEVVGCTFLNDACLDFGQNIEANEGRAIVTALVALTGNAVGVPAAAVMARGSITLPGASIINSDPAGSGVTLQAGGFITSPLPTLTGLPGTPGDQSILQFDTALSNLPATATFSVEDRMFATVFNMTRQMFRQQPAAVELTCTGTCSAAEVRDAIGSNPGRPIWVQGNLAVDSAGSIGSNGQPVLLIVNGNLTFSVAETIYGLVYLRTSDWAASGVGRIHGAVVAESNINGSGTPQIVYDAALLTRLRVSTGSMVQVPGSWRDFR